MRIIHSYWTQEIEKRDSCGGWLSEEANLMCWALSCLNAKKYYGNIELYTDDKGYGILIEKMRLPYDKVHIVFSKNSPISDIPYYLWAIPKIFVYSIQKEPFIHIDGDFIFWRKLDTEKNVVVQNREVRVPLYKKVYDDLRNEQELFTSAFSDCIDSEFIDYASNMGVFGGTDISNIVEYANNVLEFVKQNARTSHSFKSNKKDINCFLEQYYLSYFCKTKGIVLHPIHSDAVYDDKFMLTECLYNYPGKKNGFNHFLGNSKKQELMVDYVKNELFNLYPNYYREINFNCYGANMKEYYYSTLNLPLNACVQFNYLKEKLKSANILLSEELSKECLSFLEYKKSCITLSCTMRNKTNRLSEKQMVCINLDSKVKLNDCFITCKKYSIPWDELLRVDKISKMFCLQTISKKDLHTKRPYAVFLLTPFEFSVYTVFVDEVCAYILLNILDKEYKTLKQVTREVTMLLKDKTNSLEVVFEYVKKLIFNFNTYGFLTFKEYED